MQKNLRFYILVSHTLHKVKRHFSYTGILPEEAMVVINTTNDIFFKQCSTWCDSKGIPWTRTKSDGTPATGKNSVLDLFIKSKDTYMIALDGDDYLTRYEYAYYKNILQQDNPPDSLCLFRQEAQIITTFGQRFWTNNMTLPLDLNKEIDIRKGHLISEVYANNMTEYYEQIYGNLEVYVEECLNHARQNLYYVYKYYERCNINGEDRAESHCRPVWFSKPAAKECKFPNNVPVGEDTLVYLQLKNGHFQGRIVTQLVDEFEHPTYLYDCIKSDTDSVGAMLSITLNQTDYTWVRLINKKLKQMEEEGQLHALPLPINTCLPKRWKKDTYPQAHPQEYDGFDIKIWDAHWERQGAWERPSKEAEDIVEKIRQCDFYMSQEAAVAMQCIEEQKENKRKLCEALGVPVGSQISFPAFCWEDSRLYFMHSTPREVAQLYPKR